MVPKSFTAPLMYVQGPEALLLLGEQLRVLGIGNPLILASPSARRAVESTITNALDASGIKYAFLDFGGQCTFREIEKIKNACIEGGHDALVGCGGGKILDAARAAATDGAVDVKKMPREYLPGYGANIPFISVPTVASTDSPASAAAIVFTEDGKVETYICVQAHPSLVLVDTAVIARSPVRLLVAGMGDALATYFEADMSCRTATPPGGTQGLSTRTGQAVAKLCFDVIMDFGLQAKAEAEAGVPGPGIEAVTEANVLLSSLGGENNGLSAAHAISNALESSPQLFEQHQHHGECVAFGLLAQLMLEARDSDLLDRIIAFCRGVGLPTTFEELTLKNVSDAALEGVAELASRDPLIRSMVGATKSPDESGRFFDSAAILVALKAANAYGTAF